MKKCGSLKKNFFGRGFLIELQICEGTTFFEKVSGYLQAFKVCEKMWLYLLVANMDCITRKFNFEAGKHQMTPNF